MESLLSPLEVRTARSPTAMSTIESATISLGMAEIELQHLVIDVEPGEVLAPLQLHVRYYLDYGKASQQLINLCSGWVMSQRPFVFVQRIQLPARGTIRSYVGHSSTGLHYHTLTVIYRKLLPSG